MKREHIIQVANELRTYLRHKAIENAIREKYSASDEFAILRQRDEKPEEYKEYYDFVENIKKKFN